MSDKARELLRWESPMVGLRGAVARLRLMSDGSIERFSPPDFWTLHYADKHEPLAAALTTAREEGRREERAEVERLRDAMAMIQELLADEGDGVYPVQLETVYELTMTALSDVQAGEDS